MLLLVLILGFLDYFTGFELTFSFLYLLPIAMATWYIGAKQGRMLALFSALSWALSNRLAGEIYRYEVIRYWNTVERWFIFFLVAELLIELKQAFHQEQILSRTDDLTGVGNRREFFERAEVEISRARRNGTALTVAYIDLDSFKQVNDSLGHTEGDKLLKAIAGSVSEVIRKSDVFARVGGDEFVLLLPETDQEQAKSALQKIKSAIVGGITGGFASKVTLSIGVVTFRSAPESADELLHKADAMMYGVKSGTKNDIAYQVIEN